MNQVVKEEVGLSSLNSPDGSSTGTDLANTICAHRSGEIHNYVDNVLSSESTIRESKLVDEDTVKVTVRENAEKQIHIVDGVHNKSYLSAIDTVDKFRLVGKETDEGSDPNHVEEPIQFNRSSHDEKLVSSLLNTDNSTNSMTNISLPDSGCGRAGGGRLDRRAVVVVSDRVVLLHHRRSAVPAAATFERGLIDGEQRLLLGGQTLEEASLDLPKELDEVT